MAMSLKLAIAMHKQIGGRISKAGARLLPHVTKFESLTSDLAEVVGKPSPTQTAAAHLLRVAKGAKNMTAMVEQSKAGIDKIFGEEMSAILTRKMAKVPLVPNGNAREIRDRLIQMPERERLLLLTKMATENRAAELAAVTQEAAYMTGITEADQDRYRDMIFEIHAAPELADERALLADFDGVMEAYKVAKGMAADYSNEHSVGKILEAEQRASEADARLAQSLAS